jgi:WNK lysine deficient protein kinase
MSPVLELQARPLLMLVLLLLTTLGTSSTNTVGGTVSSQAAQAQPPAITSSRKGTFTDDLHKLVDNWARDAMNLSGRRGSKGHMNYEVSLPFLPFC